jgi:hypothetical protein
MARNRKSQSAAIRFGPALKAFLLCLLIGGSGVGYVWQKEQISKLGNQLKTAELRFNTLEKQNEVLRKQLANMRNPQFLELRIKEANLGLVLPQESQILRLSEPSPEPPRVEHEPQFAARSDVRSARP